MRDMEKRMKRSARVMGCALVATALALSMVPATQAHAATKKPAKVTSVKVSKVATTSAKVTWKKSPTKKAKGYQVKIYKGKKTYKTYTVKGRSTTSKTVSKLKAGTKYTTKVRAYNTKKSKKKTVKVYGKYSTAKSFATKKATKKPASNTNSNTNSNSNSNANNKPSSEHKHSYTVYHPAVWKTETVPAQFNSYEIGGIKYNEEMIIPEITKKTLVRGSYYSCEDGTVPNHEHNETIWKSEQNIVHYEDLSNLGFQCNTCKEVFPSTQERFNHSKQEGHENGETQIENYYKKKYKDDQFETILYCPVCGKIKGE